MIISLFPYELLAREPFETIRPTATAVGIPELDSPGDTACFGMVRENSGWLRWRSSPVGHFHSVGRHYVAGEDSHQQSCLATCYSTKKLDKSCYGYNQLLSN